MNCLFYTTRPGVRPRVVEVSAPGGLPVGPLAGGAEGGEHGPVPHQPHVQTRHVVMAVLPRQEPELEHRVRIRVLQFLH